MNESQATTWLVTNQRYLSAALERLRMYLERKLAGEATSPNREDLEIGFQFPDGTLPALRILRTTFNLTPFESDLLLLCAGIELDARFPALCAKLQGDPQKPFPTFGLALAVMPEAYWNALSPTSSLRYWRLIEIESSNALTRSPLRIDERILNYLTGSFHIDERLAGYIRPLPATESLVPTQEVISKKIEQAWLHRDGTRRTPLIQLCGSEVNGKHSIAAAACAGLGMNLCLLPAYLIPSNPIESESLRRLWEREAVLDASALLLDCDEPETDPGHEAVLSRWIESATYPLIVSSRERRPTGFKAALSFDVSKPTTAEQHDLWHSTLGAAAAQLNGRLDAVVSTFNFDAHTIHSIVGNILERPASSPDDLANSIWTACSNHARPRLAELAQKIEPLAHWEDLVLPATQIQTLQDIARQVRQRLKVYDTWGFAGKSARGLGISALFSGVSGTGKTMAGEVLANELNLELYRIDLSQVVSKYIGETEKNLRRVFEAAEESSVILLFDEADALFGKRSEVKDSHDRYANIEISYLLQRMEAFRGLAILTTNMKDALDQAFLRRIRFVVNFPYPDLAQRAEIWKRVFPLQTPTEDLDFARLAKLSITGGNIRNIALYAAFLAADAGEPVKMMHLSRAVQVEYAKLEKPLTEAEMGGR